MPRVSGFRDAPDAPGIEDRGPLDAVSDADLAAFAGQSTTLAQRYRWA